MNAQTHQFAHPLSNQQRGLSLVEILVGVAIGLIGIVMMFQLLENWEVRKRTTSSGSDAQISGSIASYRLAQDIRQAGYGFGTANTKIGCTVSSYDANRAIPNFTFPLIPVEIIDGAAGSADVVVSLFGSSPMMSASHRYTDSTTTSKKTTDEGPRTGIRRGDVVIVAPGTAACGMVRITDNTNADGLTINHVNGTYTDDDNNPLQPSRFNDPAGYVGAPTSGTIYNMGAAPSRNIWRVSGRVLQATNDLLNGVSEDVAEGVINLQAQYGIDTDADNIVDRWADANAADPTTPPVGVTAWSNVRAVRVAILARSQQYEKPTITIAAPTWSGGTFTMTNVDGSTDTNPDDPNDWRHYRYRVYETTVPLRNMVWGTMPGAPL